MGDSYHQQKHMGGKRRKDIGMGMVLKSRARSDVKIDIE